MNDFGKLLTQERVKQLFDYAPETGLLTRRITVCSRGRVGAIVGCDDGNGYLYMGINYKVYRLHRVIWLWVYGEFPKNQIDHINHNKTDNRISNLRKVTPQENQRNRSMPANNTSGVMGVGWHKGGGKWLARIKVNNKRINLGFFKDKAEAVAARKIAEIKYGFHRNHGKRKASYALADKALED